MSSTVSSAEQQSLVEDTAAEVARLTAGYTKLQRMLELTGVTLFFAFAALTGARLAVQAHALDLSLLQVLGIFGAATVGSLLFSDLASGLVHWAADNWGNADWPVLGSAFIRPFRLHHLDAKDITRHTWLELNGNNCLVSLPTFAAAYVALGDSPYGMFWSAFWLGVACWVLGTNQFHAWAHTDTPPAMVRALQEYGLILNKAHHDVHHTSPHNSNYCITNGWVNGPLRTLRVLEVVEWLITKITGVQANHHNVRRAAQ